MSSPFGALGTCSACPWIGPWEAVWLDELGSPSCPWCGAEEIQSVPLPEPAARHYTRVPGQCDVCDAYPLTPHAIACSAPAADRVVAAALGIVGLGANPSELARRELYAAAVGPCETASRRLEMAKMSGCALVAREVLRRAGVRHPILARPYRDQHAVSDLLDIARTAGAATSWTDGAVVTPGMVIIVGGDGREHEVEHVFTVITSDSTYVEADTTVISSVDGGQRDAGGWQTVARKDRRFTLGVDYVTAATDPGAETARHVAWLLDAPKMVRVLGQWALKVASTNRSR